MLPEWMKSSEQYVPPADGGTFAVRTIKSIGAAMARIKVQHGHEKKHHLPALVKLIGLPVVIVVLSVFMHPLLLMFFAACILGYLCTWPARDILSVMKPALFAGLLAAILFAPAVIMDTSALSNSLKVVVKVFLSVCLLGIFNHTTQWNHITGAMRKLKIPGILIFTIDITLKYIVLLGNLINDLLTSLILRSVGKNKKKYSAVGGVMGVTFVRGAEMNEQMYEAMQCRGFTDDYKGL